MGNTITAVADAGKEAIDRILEKSDKQAVDPLIIRSFTLG
jgi:hypothetical protein